MTNFDIKKDNVLIAAGTHFWCSACLTARPVDDMSENSRYCLNCYDVIQSDKKEAADMKENRDSWVKDGRMFIHYGKGYAVSPTGSQVCVGPVDEKGDVLEDVYKPPDNPSGVKNDVSKLSGDTNHVGNDIQEQKEGEFCNIKKHPGGRPRKDIEKEKVSRATRWRRKKEQQGVLL